MKKTAILLAVCLLISAVAFAAFAEDDEEEIVGFDVYSDPVKTDYIVGETIDLTGFSARILTSNGFVTQSLEGTSNASFKKNAFVSSSASELKVIPEVFVTVGETDVIIRFGDAKYLFTVNVEADPERLAGFEIASPPKKLEYTAGEKIDLAGFSATLYTGNGYVNEKLTGSGASFANNAYLDYYGIVPYVTPTEFDTPGSVKVIVTVGEFEDSFTVTVKSGIGGGDESEEPSEEPIEASKEESEEISDEVSEDKPEESKETEIVSEDEAETDMNESRETEDSGQPSSEKGGFDETVSSAERTTNDHGIALYILIGVLAAVLSSVVTILIINRKKK